MVRLFRIPQWIEHLIRDPSGGPGLNFGLVHHYFSHPVCCTANYASLKFL